MKFPDVVGIPTFFASFFALHGSPKYDELDWVNFLSPQIFQSDSKVTQSWSPSGWIDADGRMRGTTSPPLLNGHAALETINWSLAHRIGSFSLISCSQVWAGKALRSRRVSTTIAELPGKKLHREQ